MYGRRKQGETQNVVLSVRVLKAKTQETETKIGIRENASQSELKFFFLLENWLLRIGSSSSSSSSSEEICRAKGVRAGRSNFMMGS
jgi:hypothetical protein